MGKLRKVTDNLGLFSQVRIFCCPVGKKRTDFTVMLKIVPYIYTFTRIEGYFALGFFQSLPDVDDAAKRRAGLGLRAADGFFRVGQLPVNGFGIAHRFQTTGDFLRQAGWSQAH